MPRVFAHVRFVCLVGSASLVVWWLWNAGVDLFVASTLVWVIAVIALVILERVTPKQRIWLRSDEQLANDLVHTALGSALGSRVGVIAADIGVAAIALLLPALRLWPTSWPLPVQIVVGFVVLDGCRYAQHRASHAWPWLWETHQLHHDARRLLVIKAGRSHLIDRALQALCVVPIIVAGASVDVVFWVVALSSVIGLIGHANIDASGCFFFVGPNEHRVHHAADPALHGSNFGASLSIWDRLCGTFRHNDHVDVVGLPHDTPSTVTAQLAAPVTAWLGFSVPGRDDR